MYLKGKSSMLLFNKVDLTSIIISCMTLDILKNVQ